MFKNLGNLSAFSCLLGRTWLNWSPAQKNATLPSFLQIYFLFFTTHRGTSVYYFIYTVLTVGSAAPQTSLERPHAEIRTGTGVLEAT